MKKKAVIILLFGTFIVFLTTGSVQGLKMDTEDQSDLNTKIIQLEKRIILLEEKVIHLEKQIKNPDIQIVPCKQSKQ